MLFCFFVASLFAKAPGITNKNQKKDMNGDLSNKKSTRELYIIDTFKDFVIDTRGKSSVRIEVPYYNSSIIIHEKVGWQAEVFNDYNRSLSSFKASPNPRIIDIGESSGYIIINLSQIPNNELHVSGIIYSQFKFAQKCKGTRYVSIGSYHKFMVAVKKPSRSNNVTYTNKQQFCVWFASPVRTRSSVKCITQANKDIMHIVTLNDYQTSYSEISSEYSYSGSTDDVFYSKNSIFMFWTTDSSTIKDGFAIFSEPTISYSSVINDCGSGIFDYTYSYYFNAYQSNDVPTPIPLPSASYSTYDFNEYQFSLKKETIIGIIGSAISVFIIIALVYNCAADIKVDIDSSSSGKSQNNPCQLFDTNQDSKTNKSTLSPNSDNQIGESGIIYKNLI